MAPELPGEPTAPAPRPPRDARVLGLFAAALALRLAFVAAEPASRPLGDEPSWLAVADAVQAAGFDPLRLDGAFYPPLYPYLIAGGRRLFGTLTAVKAIQALLGALLVPVVARLGERALGRGAGVLAAAFAALSPVLVWYSAHFWAEPVFVLLLWLGIERVMAGDQEDALRATALGGVALGLAALTREPALYFLPVLAAWLLLGRGPRGRLHAATALGAALLVVAPWTARNYVRYGALIPVSTMGGRALWEGNTQRPRGEIYAEFDEVGAERGLVAQNRFAIGEALGEIRARQPLWFLDKLLHEVPKLLSPDNMALVTVRRRGYGAVTPAGVWLTALVTVPSYLLLMAAFVLGLSRWLPGRRAALLVAFLLFYALLHVVVHGHHRFRLPMLPAIFAIAASALPAAGAAIAPLTPRRRVLAAVLALLLVAALVPGFLGFLEEPAFFGRAGR